ncbi:DUF2721 domain-containing protein [Curvibacter sp. CHRR-16]|uniref:DUF2721 domain-containing protein n=1 Tax=Curvibacter sp. CHRR-16 TaxID=2835872 RepID=UPI001BDA1796|nr:DUF2721 domain-containing protein [Curvibacter sp. CHRR-16]MBT0571726.1 DUF2721 domain-containing protein [Curvibacter sp. CHRR-16]
MALPVDTDTISQGIRLAVAPVFFLTAVAGLIGAVATRLARIIDRARVIETQLRQGTYATTREEGFQELQGLRVRGLLANGSIALLTLCGFLIGVTIVLIFLGETGFESGGRWAIFSFMGGIASFLLALLSFMIETIFATRLLDFGRRLQQATESQAQSPPQD